MLPLPRATVKSVVPGPLRWAAPGPLQACLGGCPWRVAVGSMLLCRTRGAQARPVLKELLALHPTPEVVCRAEGLEELLRPCGLHRNRARQLQRFSCLWLSESWGDMRELPGVGVYVADAVGLFCFGCTDVECNDRVLRAYAEEVRDAAKSAC